MDTFASTTVLLVRRDGRVRMASDGQVTMNQSTIAKSGAKKIRRAGKGKVLVGFAGGGADTLALFARLEEKLEARLEPMERPIPPESIWAMRHDYEERLPKTSRARTIYFESRREAGARAAERIGLVRMMRSASFRAFAEALSGRKLASGWGLQVLRYGPGDYAGPHNDHHPENKHARHGYIDLHLSLAAPSVKHQWLVYSRAGHFSEIVPVGGPCTVTAYRLPFWHYTTPLVGGRNAARWVLLGTFLYA